MAPACGSRARSLVRPGPSGHRTAALAAAPPGRRLPRLSCRPPPQPCRARRAPRQPKYRPPVINDRSITFGPGMTWTTARSSRNSSTVSHCLRSTISRSSTATTPPEPCRASQVNERNRSAGERGAGSRHATLSRHSTEHQRHVYSAFDGSLTLTLTFIVGYSLGSKRRPWIYSHWRRRN